MRERDALMTYQPMKMPEIRSITMADVAAALRSGVADFIRAPLFGLFFGSFYAIGGLLILAALTVFETSWMIIPIAIGFPLVGPFIAVGLYEVSRTLASGEILHWNKVLLVVVRQRERQLGWMAFVVLFIFWIWIYQVRLLLALFFGFKTFSSVGDFLTLITTSTEGLGFLFTGTLVGAFLAFVLFSSTVIAMPLLLDRDIDFVSAMITSFKTVFQNPVPMLSWGVIVTVLAMIALLPAFMGLIIILPILGHATWHLFTKAIVPASQAQ